MDIFPPPWPRRDHHVHVEPGTVTARAMDPTLLPSPPECRPDRAGGSQVDHGCVEVVEFKSAPMMAFQWHPDDNAHPDRRQRALLDAAVQAAEQELVTTTRG